MSGADGRPDANLTVPQLRLNTTLLEVLFLQVDQSHIEVSSVVYHDAPQTQAPDSSQPFICVFTDRQAVRVRMWEDKDRKSQPDVGIRELVGWRHTQSETDKNQPTMCSGRAAG